MLVKFITFLGESSFLLSGLFKFKHWLYLNLMVWEARVVTASSTCSNILHLTACYSDFLTQCWCGRRELIFCKSATKPRLFLEFAVKAKLLSITESCCVKQGMKRLIKIRETVIILL